MKYYAITTADENKVLGIGTSICSAWESAVEHGNTSTPYLLLA